MKKWLAAIGIVCLLTIAFFWGGTGRDEKAQIADRGPETKAVQATASPQPTAAPAVTEQPKADNGQTPSDSGRSGEESPASTPAPSTESVPEKAPSAAPGAELKPDPAPAGTKAPVKDAADKTDETASASSSAKPPAEQPGENASDKKDKYLTDPVPEGKPKPVEWQDVTVDKKKPLTATLSVTSKTILDHLKQFNKDKLEVLPEDGVIYKSQTVTFYEGESVFDVLLREMKKNKIHMEFSMTPIYNSNYIEGINNIYEFDCGELSGWVYKVNGWFPNYGCSRYMLKDGDVVDWVYTCDLGRDIGGDQAATGAVK
ncbi:DUF4430 domain-containing protein [Paenibacillus sp. MBLB4367]|uniref:DUF4430 domain-containing protein n=1 Tax=Paenibacillus sp. MBLB4367 TaxID=3384767 RepID=UPI0039080369